MMNQEAEQNTPAISNADVTSALNGILTTDKFSASPQMSAFLRYVVEQTLIGNTRRIKAFTVGIEALGKPASFDPQTDPSVRVLAKRLRSSLDAYYVQNPDTLVFIQMKPGSYIPKFLLRSEMPSNQPTLAQLDAMPARSDSQPPASETSSAVVETADPQPLQTGYHVPTDAHDTNTSDTFDSEATTQEPTVHAAGISQLWQSHKSPSKVA